MLANHNRHDSNKGRSRSWIAQDGEDGEGFLGSGFAYRRGVVVDGVVAIRLVLTRHERVLFVLHVLFVRILSPAFNFLFNVHIVSAKLDQGLPRSAWLAMVRHPSGALLPTEYQHNSLQHPEEPSYSQDNPPKTSLAQKVSQYLRNQDTYICHDLRECSEETFALWWCCLTDVQRHDDYCSSSSKTRNEATKGHDADVGR